VKKMFHDWLLRKMRLERATEFTYVVSNKQVTINEYKNYGQKEVVIPDTLCGYPVTELGSYSFSKIRLTAVQSLIA